MVCVATKMCIPVKKRKHVMYRSYKKVIVSLLLASAWLKEVLFLHLVNAVFGDAITKGLFMTSICHVDKAMLFSYFKSVHPLLFLGRVWHVLLSVLCVAAARAAHKRSGSRVGSHSMFGLFTALVRLHLDLPLPFGADTLLQVFLYTFISVNCLAIN